eukprot:Sspe_Gene.40555::Locus_19593_Transcript_1_1_Confidence_1.000_Length_2342::g.40555::m.40555/K19603/MAPK15; mitogen-activated protein kinase 15
MVGFGGFLEEVSREYGVSGQAINYKELKHIVESNCRCSHFSHLDDARSSPPEESPLDGNGTESGGVVSPGKSSLNTETGCGVAELSEACAATDARHALELAVLFRQKLEAELKRVNTLVRKKLQMVQSRIRGILDNSRKMKGKHCTQSYGIMIAQLSNEYDDVMLLLYFLYLNIIAVSKIVKKYNKHNPRNIYTIDPYRWLFMTGGLSQAQKAKQAIEEEYSYWVDSVSSPCDSEQDLVKKSEVIKQLAVGVRQLVTAHQHHLNKHDPTSWAVQPTLSGTRSRNRGKVLTPAPVRNPCADMKTISDARILEKYQVGTVIGRGAYGIVCKATFRQTLKKVAIKTIHDAWSHQVLGQRTYREVLILQQLDHPNIIKLYEVTVDSNQRDVHLTMPYVPYTCESLLLGGHLLPVHKKWFMLQLLSALAYIHKRKVVHRDLKLSNLLIDDNPILYLSDFGLARTLADGAETTVNDNPDYVQTQWYRAPEILLCSRTSSPASDLWSVGCILAELLMGVPLFPGHDTQHQLELILACRGNPHEKRKEQNGNDIRHYSKTLIPHRTLEDTVLRLWNREGYTDEEVDCIMDLLDKLLQFDPSKRLTAVEAMQHKWFDGLPQQEEWKTAGNPVVLPLSCVKLHPVTAYRKAVAQLQLVHPDVQEFDLLTETVRFVQRVWRWKHRGGPRPPIRNLRRYRKMKKAMSRYTSSRREGISVTDTGCMSFWNGPITRSVDVNTKCKLVSCAVM